MITQRPLPLFFRIYRTTFHSSSLVLKIIKPVHKLLVFTLDTIIIANCYHTHTYYNFCIAFSIHLHYLQKRIRSESPDNQRAARNASVHIFSPVNRTQQTYPLFFSPSFHRCESPSPTNTHLCKKTLSPCYQTRYWYKHTYPISQSLYSSVTPLGMVWELRAES